MTSVNTSLDSASAVNQKIMASAVAMDVTILALPTTADTNMLLDNLKKEIDGFQVRVDRHWKNRLNWKNSNNDLD